jgi:hypothetical protein
VFCLSSPLSVNEIWFAVHGRILKCTSGTKQKNAWVVVLWPVRVKAWQNPGTLGNTTRKFPYPECKQQQSARADEHARDKDSTWVIHRRKSHIHRCFQVSMFEIVHHITTSCVFTQHSTVQWHTVPWLNTALIFSWTELPTCRYWSHSFRTTVKGKDVPVYTTTT